MQLPILVQVTPGAGPWEVRVGDGQAADRRADVPAAAVARHLAEVEAALAPVGAAPGRAAAAAARTRGEERAGRALAALLAEAGPAWAHLKYLLGERRGAGHDPVVVVDARAQEARRLPWELLAEEPGGPLLETRGTVVARLAPGDFAAPAAPAAGLTVLHWAPAPDAVAADLAAALAATLAEVGLQRRVLAGDPGDLPDGALVLHVTCHGTASLEAAAFVLGDTERAVGSVAHVLAPVLRRAAAVVLDVCEAGAATEAQIESVAGGFVAAGAASCVAPVRQAHTTALAAFARGFYAALAGGEPVRRAVARGRRAVGDTGLPMVEGRWANQAWHVRDLAAAGAPAPLLRRWRPEGWPAVAGDLADALEAARARAVELHHGYVGAEHLALAIPRVGAAGPLGSFLALALTRPEQEKALLACPASLVPAAGRALPYEATPRLLRAAAHLAAGATTEDALAVLLHEPGHPLHDVGGRFVGLRAPVQPGATLASLGPGEPAPDPPAPDPAPADALEVMGGPEDGRRLALAPGDHVGRWDPETPAEHALYADTWLYDASLGRQHLRYAGPGRFELTRRGRLERGGVVTEVPVGAVDLVEGDVVHLGRATRLRGVRGA